MKTRRKYHDEDKMDEEDKMEFGCIGQTQLKTISWTMNLPFFLVFQKYLHKYQLIFGNQCLTDNSRLYFLDEVSNMVGYSRF